MKKHLLILTVLIISNNCFSQSYFNQISSEKPKKQESVLIEKPISESKNLNTSETKDKEFYISRVQKVKRELENLKASKSKSDSILNNNINYYKEKIISKNSKKKKEHFLDELDFLQEQSNELDSTFNIERLRIENEVIKFKDTLFMVIKLELLKSKNLNNSNGFLDTLKIFPPVKNGIYITSAFGNRIHPITNKMTFHNGIDIRTDKQQVFAVLSGTITKVDYSKKLGIYIEVTHYRNIKSIYGHLSETLVLENTKVAENTAIAITGGTGTVTAPHLHFILKNGNEYLNPTDLFKEQIL
jgi:murein DD-endopeptidase MepM/ murein hydrolase activator NlpD